MATNDAIPLDDRLASELADRYRIDQVVGRGSSATVYRAHDLRHDRPVALKVLHSALGEVVGAERFLREIRMVARLQHPNILPLFDSGSAAGLLYYTTPYVESGSLRDRLTAAGTLPVPAVLQLTTQLAFALAYAHSVGVVHRDIKPENILVSPTGHALLTDFGIAHRWESSSVPGGASARLTETGVTLGTPAYMSPEQSAGDEPVDERSDIYSLAAVAYEALTGEPPFTGPNARAIMARRLTEPAPVAGRMRPDLPPEMDRAISRALAREPADRFSSGMEFAVALASVDLPAAPLAALEPTKRRPMRLVLAGLLLAALGAAGIAGYYLLRDGGREPSGARAGRPVLVVLPFKNLGPADDQYFADGLTEEITSRLSGMSGLRVISRTSADQYRTSDKSLQEIGAELGAGYVLEGSVRWSGTSPEDPGRIRVTPQLIQVADDSHLWADAYEAELSGVFQVQSEIAERVTTALDVALRAPERATLALGGTRSSEAYDLYLRGNDRLRRENERQDIQAAVELYRRAVALDTGFALAYARLSQANAAMYWYHYDHSEERRRQAWEAAEAARRAAPELPETHIALGYYHYWGHLNYDAALEQFQQARRRQPSNGELLAAIGYVERRRGRWDEALAALGEALQYDPRSPLVALSLGDTYLTTRRYAEAEHYIDRAIALRPDWANAYAYKAALYVVWKGDLERARGVVSRALATIDASALAHTFMHTDRVSAVPLTYDSAFLPVIDRLVMAKFQDSARYHMLKAESYRFRGERRAEHAYADSARALLERRLLVRPDDAKTMAPLALMYAALGRSADAIRTGTRAAQLLPVSLDAYSGPLMLSYLARVYVMVGQPERAIDELEQLLQIPNWISRGELRADPVWAPLRPYSRFQRLIGATQARRSRPPTSGTAGRRAPAPRRRRPPAPGWAAPPSPAPRPAPAPPA